MNIDVITPDRKVLTGQFDSVRFPGLDGSFEVLDNHASLITVGSGVMHLRSGATERLFDIEGGLIEVLKNQVSILAEKVAEK